MEKRVHTRYAAADRICITLLPDDENAAETETFYCQTDDISAEGLRFTGDAPLTRGQVVNILVVRESAYWGFSLKGRVVWVKPGEPANSSSFGIQFFDLPEPTRRAWSEAVERCALPE